MGGHANGADQCTLHLSTDDGMGTTRSRERASVHRRRDHREHGETPEEILRNHGRDVRSVLQTLAKHNILVSPKKVQMFVKEVEFCGHILSEGRKRPAPGKLMAVQKWELPATVTQLRDFWD